MRKSYLKLKIEERQSNTNVISGIYERAAADNGRDLTDAEQKQVEEAEARCKVLDAEIETYQRMAEGANKFAGMAGQVREDDERAEEDRAKAAANAANTTAAKPTGYGEKLVASDEFRAYTGRGTMDPVAFDDYVETRAPIMTDDLLLSPQRWVGPQQPTFATPLLAACGRVQTSTTAVQYVSYGPPSDAAVVPEGEEKPEATWADTPNTVTLATIAHWRAITRQAIEDLPQIRTIVDGLLRRGVAQKLEADAAAALTGATFAQATGDTILQAIRVAVGMVQSVGFTPSSVLLNPGDYADLDLAVMEATVNGPTRGSNFWGLTAIPSNSVPAGSAYVGDVGTGLTWFDRGSTEVLITDSHSDFFVKNMLVILAETRAAFAVTESQAIVVASTDGS